MFFSRYIRQLGNRRYFPDPLSGVPRPLVNPLPPNTPYAIPSLWLVGPRRALTKRNTTGKQRCDRSLYIVKRGSIHRLIGVAVWKELLICLRVVTSKNSHICNSTHFVSNNIEFFLNYFTQWYLNKRLKFCNDILLLKAYYDVIGTL